MPELEAAPPVAPPTDTLPNPVILPDVEFSMSTFKQEMENAGAAPQTPAETPAVTDPAETPPAPETKPDEPAAPAKDPLSVPDELIDGKPAERPQADADKAIAEIDAMVLPKNAKPEQVASFSKLKESAKKAIEEKLARITELEAKTTGTATAKEIEAAAARAEAAEKRAADLEETLNRTAFEKSPKFQAQFTDAETAAVEGAKSYLEGTEVNPNVIDLAARSSGAKRLQILRDAGVDAETLAAVAPHLAQYDSIQREKAKTLERWQETAQSWQAEEAKKAEASQQQRVAEEDRVWSTVMSKAANDILPLRRVDGNIAWNEQAEKLSAKAKEIFNGSGTALDELASTIAQGVAYPVLNRVVTDLREQVKSLREENGKLKSARPGGSDISGVKPPDGGKEMTVEERAKATFNANLNAARGG